MTSCSPRSVGRSASCLRTAATRSTTSSSRSSSPRGATPTNVRGPEQRLQLAGRLIASIVPLGVATGNVTVAFAILSYAGGGGDFAGGRRVTGQPLPLLRGDQARREHGGPDRLRRGHRARPADQCRRSALGEKARGDRRRCTVVPGAELSIRDSPKCLIDVLAAAVPGRLSAGGTSNGVAHGISFSTGSRLG